MREEDKPIFYALSDLEAMALTIHGEARGESWEGKLAVGFVIVNRSRLWKKSIRDVVFKDNEFSCYNTNPPQAKTDPNYQPLFNLATDLNEDKRNWQYINGECWEAAQVCLNGWNESTVGDATFYRVIGNKNKWFDGQIKRGKLIKVCEIGHHEFYKEAL